MIEAFPMLSLELKQLLLELGQLGLVAASWRREAWFGLLALFMLQGILNLFLILVGVEKLTTHVNVALWHLLSNQLFHGLHWRAEAVLLEDTALLTQL